jgi:hypothetical protein
LWKRYVWGVCVGINDYPVEYWSGGPGKTHRRSPNPPEPFVIVCPLTIEWTNLWESISSLLPR